MCIYIYIFIIYMYMYVYTLQWFQRFYKAGLSGRLLEDSNIQFTYPWESAEDTTPDTPEPPHTEPTSEADTCSQIALESWGIAIESNLIQHSTYIHIYIYRYVYIYIYRYVYIYIYTYQICALCIGIWVCLKMGYPKIAWGIFILPIV